MATSVGAVVNLFIILQWTVGIGAVGRWSRDQSGDKSEQPFYRKAATAAAAAGVDDNASFKYCRSERAFTW